MDYEGFEECFPVWMFFEITKGSARPEIGRGPVAVCRTERVEVTGRAKVPSLSHAHLFPAAGHAYLYDPFNGNGGGDGYLLIGKSLYRSLGRAYLSAGEEPNQAWRKFFEMRPHFDF